MNSRFPICAIALILLAACGNKKSDSAADVTAPASATAIAADTEEKPVAEREHVDRNSANPGLQPEQKIGGSEGRSPFEGERVINLNAVVNRSLTVIRALDADRAAMRQTIETAVIPGASAAAREKAAKTMESLGALYDEAKLARDDMAAAERDLKASGEYFDEVIFYGMVKFTQDVELELREEKASFAALLAGELAQ